MSINRKPNPTGVDEIIDRWQDLLYTGLLNRGWADYESYHRAYKDIDKGTVNPMIHIINSDMEQVPMNDKFAVNSFFLVSDDSEEVNGLMESTVSVIFQGDLKKIYPNSPHRFDEELINDVKAVSRNLDGRFRDIKISRGIENVYAEFNTELIKEKLHDRQPYNVVRFDMTVKYQHHCSDVYAKVIPPIIIGRSYSSSYSSSYN